ncbi:MAG: tetratricopeptide repeat protein, partial [Planctomycetaceae bacterium]
MIRKTGGWTAAVMAMAIVGFAGAPRSALAQGSKWQADHDAGWQAYQEGRLDEAETRLRAAEKEAEGFGANDPRLATTLDHLSWVLCTEGKSAEAEPLAKRALALREQALGGEHPDVVKSLNTLACLYDMEGKPAEAKPLYERCLALAEK